MQPFLCWRRADGSAAFRWFDPTLAAFDVVELPAGTTSPRCVLDDKRHVSGTIAGASDIILAYIRGGALYYRQQRDRFLIEYELANGLHGAELDQIGMNTHNRLQFRLLGGPTSQHAPVSLERIVRNLAARCGVVDVDARDLTEVYVDGYQITALTTGRAAIEPLRMVGAFDLVERGTTLRFPTRGKTPVATLTEDELGVRSLDTDPGPAITTRKAQDVELPRQIRLRYPSLSRDYEIGEQLSPARMGTVGVNDVSVDCPVVMTDSTAAKIAERLFREAWASRHAHSFTVGAQHHALEPADVILVPVDGRLQRMRIVSFNDSGLIVRTAEAVRDDDGAYVSIAIATDPPRRPSLIELIGETEIVLLDVPPLREEDDNAGVYLAARRSGTGQSWPGARIFRSVDSGTTYQSLMAISKQAVIGTVVSAPSSGALYRWDTQQEYVIDILSGELESKTIEGVLNGQNMAAVGADGRWHLFQVANAELIDDNRYRLTRLLLGRRGTERFIETVEVGDTFVLLTGGGMYRVPLQTSEIGAERLYRAVTNGEQIDAVDDEEFTGEGVDRKSTSLKSSHGKT